ncbi:unnamed protein product [Staurois parvus]|uniref:Uncharacterized protein n=1 Tax=Staurois parvus TaxID=386267 RepID=A0ABN9FLT8_9NEOB|nr:unnamed protein product [Staurois parvus]
MEGIVAHCWCQWEEFAPSLVLIGVIVPHGWCHWKELYPSTGVSGRNCALL